MLILRRLVICSFVVFLLSISSFADPVRIISGNTTAVKTSSVNNFNFHLVDAKGNIYQGFREIVPFSLAPIGTIVNPGDVIANIFTFPLNGFGGTGGLSGGFTQLGGIPYFNVFWTGSLNYTLLQSAVVPTFTATSGNILTVTVPFSMTGVLSPFCTTTIAGGGDCANINGTTQNVSGNGNATLTFVRDSNGNIVYQSAQYRFSTPEPVPEPATLLLLGTGLAGLAGYAAKRRKKKAEPGT